jgi:hypothetical protein
MKIFDETLKMVAFCVTKPVQQTTTISCCIQQVKAKFRSPRRFNVLASEDMHRSSYRRSLTNFRKVRFATILVEVGRPVLEDEEAAAPHNTSLWHSAEDYAAFQADVERIVERYHRGCRSDDLLGLEHLLCPCEEEPCHQRTDLSSP